MSTAPSRALHATLERPQGTPAARRPPRGDVNARRRCRGRLRRRRSGQSAARAWTRAGPARGSGPRRWGPHPASGARAGASAATAWARAGHRRGRRPTRESPRPARGRPARCPGGPPAAGQHLTGRRTPRRWTSATCSACRSAGALIAPTAFLCCKLNLNMADPATSNVLLNLHPKKS